MYGAIPDGPLEGALLLSVTPAGAGGVLTGSLVRATDGLERENATARLMATGMQLVLGGRSLQFRRSGAIDAQALADIPIIAHRGMSLGSASLGNSARGIEHAWLFGASGVELDVVVPYSGNDRARRPLVSELRVHHPPVVRAEITGFDSSSLAEVQGALRPRAALSLASLHHLPFVYIDPKLRWVQRNDGVMRETLRELTAAAREAADRDPALHVLIGAETNRAAELLAESGWPVSQPRFGWAQELTRGTDLEGAMRRAGLAPDRRSAALSLNLLAVRGGNGGLLGWFLRDLDRFESRIAALEQPLIFWTAASESQFAGALSARSRLGRNNPRRVAAIMTPRPHRLAYFLASGGISR